MASASPSASSSTLKRTNEDLLDLYDVAYRAIMGQESEEDKVLIEREAKRRRMITPPPPIPRPAEEKETQPSQGTQEYLMRTVGDESDSQDESFEGTVTGTDKSLAVYRNLRSDSAAATATTAAAANVTGGRAVVAVGSDSVHVTGDSYSSTQDSMDTDINKDTDNLDDSDYVE